MSIRTWRRLFTVAAVTGAVLAVSACSPFGGSEASNKTLNVTAFDATDVTVLKEIGKLFTEQHKGWTVNVTQIAEANYQTKLRLSVSAGSPPDVAYLYAKGEATNFQPIDDTVYKDHNISPSSMNTAALDYSCKVEGKYYCIGGYAGAVVLYYNKKIFKDAGVAYPSSSTPMTFAEYSALAAKLTKVSAAGKTPTIYGGDAEPPVYYVDPGTFLNKTGKTAQLTSAGNVEIWNQLQGMISAKTSPTPSSLAASPSANQLSEGKLAMAIGDNTAIATFNEAGVDWGVAPVPVEEGEKPWVNVYTNSFGIPRKAAHPSEAADFLNLLATDGQKLEADQGLLPMNTSIAEKTFGAKSSAQEQFLEVTKLARTGTFTPNLYAWQQPFYDAWQSVAIGKQTSSSALASAQPKVQQQLDVTWQVWNDSLASLK